MKRLFFMIIFSAMLTSSNAQYFENENWTIKSNSPDYGVFTVIDNFFFADDGTFTYNCGYSSGTYHIETYWGTYKYNLGTNKITLNIAGAFARGTPDNNLRNVLPSKLIVARLDDNEIVVRGFKNKAEKTYIRKKHCEKTEL